MFPVSEIITVPLNVCACPIQKDTKRSSKDEHHRWRFWTKSQKIGWYSTTSSGKVAWACLIHLCLFMLFCVFFDVCEFLTLSDDKFGAKRDRCVCPLMQFGILSVTNRARNVTNVFGHAVNVFCSLRRVWTFGLVSDKNGTDALAYCNLEIMK